MTLINSVVYFVGSDIIFQQLRRQPECLWSRILKSKRAGVRHQPDINRLGNLMIDAPGIDALNQFVNQATGRRFFLVYDFKITDDVIFWMMINTDTGDFRLSQIITQTADTRDPTYIQNKSQIKFTQASGIPIRIILPDHFAGVQKGVFLGQSRTVQNFNRFLHALQTIIQRHFRTDRVAVRIYMCRQQDFLCRLQLLYDWIPVVTHK